MQKKSIWLANFSLGSLELECKSARCAASCTHEHRQVKGGVSTEHGYVNLASYSGKYTPEQSTVYAREVKSFIQKRFNRKRVPRKAELTHLERLARASEARWKGGQASAVQALISQETFPLRQWENEYDAAVGRQSVNKVCFPREEEDESDSWEIVEPEPDPGKPNYAQLEFLAGGGVLDYHSGFKLGESFTVRDDYVGRTEVPQNVKAPKPVDQYNRVLQKAGDEEQLDLSTSHEIEMRKREELARHDEDYMKANSTGRRLLKRRTGTRSPRTWKSTSTAGLEWKKIRAEMRSTVRRSSMDWVSETTGRSVRLI